MPRAAGYGGRVMVGNTIVFANKWSVDYAVETDDGTGTQGNQTIPFNPVGNLYRLNTKTQYIRVVDITINLEAYYDSSHGWLTAAAGQGGSAFALFPGKEVELTLFPATHLRPTALWNFKRALITQCTQTVEVRQIVKLVITAKNNGPNYTINI